jgi:methylase of polypeptide subunit release factors
MDKKWHSAWSKFQESLPHTKAPFSKRNWGTSLHSLCSYQAKLKPSIAHHLIKMFTSEGEKVIDPFSGSGTIPLEAALNGRTAVGIDISQMATAISQAKINQCSFGDCLDILESLATRIDFIKKNPKRAEQKITVAFNKTIPEYFHPDTLQELLVARDFFKDTQDLSDPAWCMCFSSALHVLHGNRPYALSRRSHPLTPYAPSGEFIYKNVVDHITAKVHKSCKEQATLPLTSGSAFCQDICEPWPAQASQADAIITSPPFVSSTRFYMTNWMRFWFSGWEKEDFEHATDAFVEKKQLKSLDVYDDIFSRFYENLKPGGLVVFHVGKNKKVNMGEQFSKRQFSGFKLLDFFTENTAQLESHGIRDKGSTVEHQYLIYELR